MQIVACELSNQLIARIVCGTDFTITHKKSLLIDELYNFDNIKDMTIVN